MSVVVSDTTPLNYLILIGHIDVLPCLFGKILVPPAVLHELNHTLTPAPVVAWANNLPDWVEIRSPRTDPHLGIDAGETEAIALAIELGIPAVLMDDRKGRAAAIDRGLDVLGTILILEIADESGLLDLEDAASRLRATNFRLEEALWQTIRARVRARRIG